MANFLSLVTGGISEEERQLLFSQGAADLHSFLEAHPETEQQVLDILRRRLDVDADEKTFGVLHDNLTSYLGKDLATLVGWVGQFDQYNRMQELEKYASPPVAAFLRMILSLYGPELLRAYQKWNRFPNEWSMCYREVYFDLTNQRYLVKVRIEKYNGEQIVIEDRPDGILDLITKLIYSVRIVGSPDAFSQQQINSYLEEVTPLTKLLTREKEETSSASPVSQTVNETP